MSAQIRKLTLAVLAGSCSASTPPHNASPPPRETTVEVLAAPTPRFPSEPGRFAPALTRTHEGAPSGAMLANVAACAECHAAIAAQWNSSAHAFASFSNPIYLNAVQRLRRDVGLEQSQFCGGCHDPALLVDGAMLSDVAADDPRAHAGVACLVCHSATRSNQEGNASYTLARRSPLAPDTADAGSVAAHRRAMRPTPLSSADLCASCHRAFLSEATGNAWHLPGTDDVTSWRRSAHAGSTATDLAVTTGLNTCQGCHMPTIETDLPDAAAENGRVTSHQFVGAHTWLAQMRNDGDLLKAVNSKLRSAVQLDIAAVHGPGSTLYLPERFGLVEQPLVVDVVVSNAGTGHRFPGGTRDIADTWLEAELVDATGASLAAAGIEHERSGDDPTAHRFLTPPGNRSGQPVRAHETHLFRAPLFDTTILPHDSAVVRFALPPTSDLPRVPSEFRVRLKHRSRSLAIQGATCSAAKTDDARAFRVAAAQQRGSTLDPCRPQPVLVLAERRLVLSPKPTAAKPQNSAMRLYRYGKGLLANLQEHLDELRPLLAYASQFAALSSFERARFDWLGARLAARQGRLDEALTELARAERRVGTSAALARTRGDAYASVWRWADAARAYQVAAQSAPGDDESWAQLARARGSAGDALGALEAATRGLLLEPRGEQLLRSQAVAMRELRFIDAQLNQALDTYLTHRAVPEGPELRARCQESSWHCALEQLPVHVHALEVPNTP